MSWAAIIPLIAAGIGAAGQIAGKASEKRAAGRAAESGIALTERSQDISAQQSQQQAMLELARLIEQGSMDRAKLGITAPAERAKQSTLGDLIANVQDVSIAGVPSHIPLPNISGGLRPSALGPGARAAGRGLSRDALLALLNKSDVPAPMNTAGLIKPTPGPANLPQATGTDTFLNVLATLGGLAGAASPYLPQDRLPARGLPGGNTSPTIPAPSPRRPY